MNLNDNSQHGTTTETNTDNASGGQPSSPTSQSMSTASAEENKSGKDENGNPVDQKHPLDSSGEAQRSKPDLSFGEKAVGKTFNPSKDPEVDKCKQLFADLIDQMNDLIGSNDRNGKTRHAQIAITMMEDAQMRAVKALTWKD